MSDEYKLNAATAKAVRAKSLLENDLLVEAFKTLEDAYTVAWRTTMIEDVSAREKLFLAINIVGKVREHLQKAVSNGVVAQRELRDLAELAERRKRYGVF